MTSTLHQNTSSQNKSKMSSNNQPPVSNHPFDDMPFPSSQMPKSTDHSDDHFFERLPSHQPGELPPPNHSYCNETQHHCTNCATSLASTTATLLAQKRKYDVISLLEQYVEQLVKILEGKDLVDVDVPEMFNLLYSKILSRFERKNNGPPI